MRGHEDAGRPAVGREGGPVSLWGDARRRLRRNPVAVASLLVIVAFTLMGLLAPLIAPYDPLEYHLYNTDYPPAWQKNAPGGKSGDARFPLGTDSAGRDLLSRLLYGTRSSMLIGLLTAPLVAAVGIGVGLVAGLAGPRVDNLLMRLTDVFYAFPSILFTIMMVLILRDTRLGAWLGGTVMLMVALALVSWVGAARLVRGGVLSVKEEQYVEAARCIGVPRRRLLLHHVLPNCLGPVVVWIAFMIPRLIIAEAILGYLGIGLKPVYDSSQAFAITSWGGLFLDGRRAMSSRPWMMLAPALCVTLVAMAFNLFGDTLRDALDPKAGN
jgi:oligopeptide transport system permease protein